MKQQLMPYAIIAGITIVFAFLALGWTFVATMNGDAIIWCGLGVTVGLVIATEAYYAWKKSKPAVIER
jgi:hypothetical protein